MCAAKFDPAMFAELFDDAAIFPPGNLPLAQAVEQHYQFRASRRHPFIGTFVVGAKSLDDLERVLEGLRNRAPGKLAPINLSVTVPLPAVSKALQRADEISGVQVASIEVSVPDGISADQIVASLRSELAHRNRPLSTFIEVPRDERAPILISHMRDGEFFAKFRTGGIRQELYPSVDDLAESIRAAVAANIPFKATAGLHHALRNTDPETMFDQHGFLNVLLAAQDAREGKPLSTIADTLAERDRESLRTRAEQLDPAVRAMFLSFGTCSVTDPITELVELGFLDSSLTENEE